MKLSVQQTNFIQLILRSPDRGDGWRHVSGFLTPMAEKQATENPELFETRQDGAAFMLRLSDRGLILADYI